MARRALVTEGHRGATEVVGENEGPRVTDPRRSRSAAAETDTGAEADSTLERALLLQAVLDAIPFPISARSKDGRWRASNAAYVAGPGRPRPARGTYSVPGEVEAAFHSAHDGPVLESGSVDTYEADLFLPDGTSRRQLVTKAPLRSGDGEIVGIVSAGMDISDRYAAEQALRSSEERFRTLFGIPA